MATPSSGLHAFGLNDNPQLFTDAVQPYEPHPFTQDSGLPQWSHQDFSAKKTVCITDLKKTPLGAYGDSSKDPRPEFVASSDRQREMFLEDQKRNLQRTDSPTMKELFQPGDKDEGDGYWGVIREGRDQSTPHWSHWQYTMKKTHHATGVNKKESAANDVNARSAAQAHYRDPRTWTNSSGSRRDSANRSSERAQTDSSKKSYSSHAHLALAKRRHATQIESNQSQGPQRVFEAMQSPGYQYFSDRSRFSRPSSARRTSETGFTPRSDFRGSPGSTPYPAAEYAMDDYSGYSSTSQRPRFGAEISLSPRVIPLKSATPGYSLAQITRQDGIDLDPFYDRSLGCLPRGSPEINPTSLYKSHAELSSHKTLCKTDIKYTPNFAVRPASNVHSGFDRRNSQSEARERRSRSADPVASRGSKSGRQPRQVDMRASPRPETPKSASGRSGVKTSSRRRAATADGGRR
mmetsp:Transcript_142195/g.247856  ORF Transcript_142195/g.247856 Transcript_142195/m.247856 type:complete len:462 (-) Transcript_142195:267-1652(-)